MLPLKAVVLSTGVVSMAVMLKLSLPVILDFLTSELPLFWSFALSWLQPPYLYLLINCIILSIVASSKLQPRGGGDSDGDREFVAPSSVGTTTMVKVLAEEREISVQEDVVVFGYVDESVSPVVVLENRDQNHKQNEICVVSPLKKIEVTAKVEDDGDDDVENREKLGDEFEISRKSMWSSPEKSKAEKPPFSARFGHRRAVKASPEGKASLKVSRPKKHETLESTWRTMTEGRSMPLTRHLRKSDTFAGASPETSPVRVIKKSDTFSGGNLSPASGGSGSGRLRRESSPSQDELNRRVEAFIKKFNEEMRLQRQESLSQYKDMINTNRGSH